METTTTTDSISTWDNVIAAYNRAVAETVAFLPGLVLFLLILVVGYFVAKMMSGVIAKGLEKIGFDKMLERGGIKRAMEASGHHVSAMIGKLLFFVLFLLVLQIAVGVFGEANPISLLLQRVIAFLPNILIAIVIVTVSASMAAVVRDMIGAALGGLSYGKTLATIAGASIVIVGIFAALSQVQVAPHIVDGLFYAMLAIVSGSAIVAIGGGGIAPMRARWDRALQVLEQEVPRVVEEAQGSSQA